MPEPTGGGARVQGEDGHCYVYGWSGNLGREVIEFKPRQQYLYGSFRLDRVVRELPQQAGVQPPDAFGLRRYELTNHLGNVGKVIGEETTDYTNIAGRTYSVPGAVAHRDYFVFGLELNRPAEGNHAARGEIGLRVEPYRFAFKGKELDDSGERGSLTMIYEYRS